MVSFFENDDEVLVPTKAENVWSTDQLSTFQGNNVWPFMWKSYSSICRCSGLCDRIGFS